MISKTFRMLCLAGIAWISFALQSCMDCSKKVSCPAFSDELLEQWSPYRDGIGVKFNSSGQPTTIFTIDSVSTSQPYEIQTSAPIRCMAEKVWAAQEQLNDGQPAFRIKLEMMEPMQGNASRNLYINLLGSRITVEQLTEHGFFQARSESGSGSVQNFPSIVLNGKSFSNVQCAVFDTTAIKKQTIHKLYLSKGQGVIGYETSSPQLLWVKE